MLEHAADEMAPLRCAPGLRLVSVVEAPNATGLIKPLLMFSALARNGLPPWRPLEHLMITTRRSMTNSNGDLLQLAARQSGLPFVAIPERRLFDVGVLSQLTAAVRDFGPDIVETHGSKFHFLFYLLRLCHPSFRKYRWVAFHHGYTKTSYRVRAYQQLDRLSLRHASRVVTFCKPFAGMLQQRGVKAEAISVISNAVTATSFPDLQRIQTQRALLGAAPNDCIVLSVGRLSPEKGIADLLTAFAIAVKKATSPMRLFIAGDGPERRRLEGMASHLSDRVHFLGHVEDPWILYHTADMFVLSSHSEGSPLVVLEAMTAGLPILSTGVGGVPEILSNGLTAILTKPGDIQEFAQQMVALADDSAMRASLGRAATSALARHSPQAYAERLMEIYSQAIA